MLLLLSGAGELGHSIHIHGHVVKVAFKDGHPLPNPYDADTISVAPGERYDIFIDADNPGIWMVHDHVDSHTVNGDRPMGGIMTVIQYEEIDAKKQDFYEWKDKKIVPDFYYEESMKRSEEHTSELQSLMRISYADFCLQKKKAHNPYNN